MFVTISSLNLNADDFWLMFEKNAKLNQYIKVFERNVQFSIIFRLLILL